MNVIRSLDWVLHPLESATFLDEVWGRRHYVVRRHCPQYFDDLVSASELEDFLEYARPDDSTVRLVRKAEKRDPASIRLANGAIDLVRIRNDFADGYTIVLNGLEWHVPAIAELAHAIEVELNFETQVNAYLTPPKSQGFLPHYDDHDVMILQIQGSKIWHIYDASSDVAPRDLRLREPFVGGDLPAPTDLCLEAGDVLYLPRGRVHAAEATSEPSIHLTFGIHAPTVQSLVTQALNALSRRDDRVQARLPPRYLDDADVRASLDGLVRDVVQSIGEPSVVADGLGAVEDALVRRGRCRPVGRLVSNAAETERVDDRSVVVKCQPLYSRVLAMGGGVALQFAHSLVSAGPDHRTAMLFVSKSTKPFRVGDLPGLSAPQQIELARKLVVDGFLILLPDE